MLYVTVKNLEVVCIPSVLKFFFLTIYG